MNFLEKLWQAILNFFASLNVPVPKEENLTNDWEGLVKAYQKYDKDDFFKEASLAQWILESGRGTSDLSKEHLNFGGLKWRAAMKGFATPVLIKVPSEIAPVEFCKFNSVQNFIDGYWAFIGRSPYKGWEEQTTAWGYLNHITKAGYATDPSYMKKVLSLLSEARDLLLDDNAEPERPSDPPKEQGYVIPKIVTVKGVRYNTHGNYRTQTGNAKGLVVHYTVSGRKVSNARGVVSYLKSQGYGCMVMDEKGIIYVPEGFDLQKDVAWHAGTSSWKGVSGISRYCMGMEICNWGKLDSKTKPRAGTTRTSGAMANIKAGEYEAYTPEQEESLINFIRWQLDTNPEFDLDWVVGHDEVCVPKGRKSDPGGSLSMTMPEFRKHIEEFM